MNSSDLPKTQPASAQAAKKRSVKPDPARVRALAWVLGLLVALAAWHFWPREKLYYMVPPTRGAFDHSYASWRPVVAALAAGGKPTAEALRAHREALQQGVTHFSAVTPSEYSQWSRARQAAFVLNVYQATVLKLQADKAERGELVELKAGWGGDFAPRVVRFLGRLWSLKELETKWLRQSTSDPRAAAVLYRGTADSPPLRAEPFIAEKLDAQWREAAAQ